jgi:hypothetical protein
VSAVLQFPKVLNMPREARLIADEARLKAWYDNLPFEEPRKGMDQWYTLHEVRAATGIPLTRLPTVLFRHGWITGRRPGFPLTFYHGPNGFNELEAP